MTLFKWTDCGRHAALHEPYMRLTRFGVVTVPAGFETDFASVPRIFWTLIPPIGRYNMAAVVHDFLYRTQPDGWTRKQADTVFLDHMLEDGVPRLRARTMYRAVRLGAWRSWRKSKN